jgi:hypothetical protein
MQKSDFRMHQPVSFGRKRGATAYGKIVKLNPKKAKVQLTQSYNSSPAGAVWGVPYELLKPIENGKIVEPKPEPLSPLQFGPDEHILKAIASCYYELEPEILSCDGEATLGHIRQRQAELNRKLKGLFLAFGREVSATEIYEWEDNAKESPKR